MRDIAKMIRVSDETIAKHIEPKPDEHKGQKVYIHYFIVRY